MEYKDYYQIMGVERNADAAAVKRAYRLLARKYHPDVSAEADAEQRFKEVGEAYDVLKDPEKRAAYDQLGENWQSGQSFQPPPDWGTGAEYSSQGFDGGFGGQSNSTHSDFFESLFGHAFSQADHGFQQSPNNDHHAKILIDLEDSLSGTTRSITLQVPQMDGQGRMLQKARVLEIKIPKGIRNGQHIRLAGQAQTSAGGAPGDLFLEVSIKPHKLYRVEGADLHYQLPLAPWEAALGAKVKVPTPSGTVSLKISADAKDGQQMALRGRGLPSKTPGDLFVELSIVLPKADTPEAKELYRQMEKTMAFNPRQHLGV